MKPVLIWVTCFTVLWWIFSPEKKVTLGNGIKVSQAPIQSAIKDPTPFNINDYKITPLAKFDIEAKVLAKKKYSFDPGAAVSPIDLALGWQSMSDEEVLKDIEITQSNRWYFWQTKNMSISKKEVIAQSANMHIIPANDYIEDLLKNVKKGQIVFISGSLVRVDAKEKNWHWESSLTRNDTGGGSCELIYADYVDIQSL